MLVEWAATFVCRLARFWVEQIFRVLPPTTIYVTDSRKMTKSRNGNPLKLLSQELVTSKHKKKGTILSYIFADTHVTLSSGSWLCYNQIYLFNYFLHPRPPPSLVVLCEWKKVQITIISPSYLQTLNQSRNCFLVLSIPSLDCVCNWRFDDDILTNHDLLNELMN